MAVAANPSMFSYSRRASSIRAAVFLARQRIKEIKACQRVNKNIGCLWCPMSKGKKATFSALDMEAQRRDLMEAIIAKENIYSQIVPLRK